MSIISDLKENVKNKNRQKLLKQKFQEINSIIDEYKEKYYKEALGLQGYTHFATKEAEEKIFEIIDEDDDIFTILNNKNQNLGMISANAGLENVVLRSLDNKEASLQQDLDGENIGMYSALNGLENATFKAIENYEACKQKSEVGNTILLFCPAGGLEECAIKILDLYPELINQHQYNREMINIEFLAYFHRQDKLKNKICEIEEKQMELELELKNNISETNSNSEQKQVERENGLCYLEDSQEEYYE